MVRKIMLLTVMLFTAVGVINTETQHLIFIPTPIRSPQLELLYNNVWGAVYNPVKKQCDDTPTITGDGSKINLNKASNYRWIAISQEMLNSKFRANKLLYPERDDRFKGKIQYGDTIWIDSPNKNINGWWVVHDSKNARYKRSIDFLQANGDGSLYGNNPLWNGKFDNINIYRFKDSNHVDSNLLASNQTNNKYTITNMKIITPKSHITIVDKNTIQRVSLPQLNLSNSFDNNLKPLKLLV